MIEINIPDASYSDIDVSLNGVMYNMEFKWVSTTKAWYIDIRRDGEVVVVNAKLLPYTNILNRVDKTLISGLLMPIMRNKTEQPITRHNIGSDKPYRLVYD